MGRVSLCYSIAALRRCHIVEMCAGGLPQEPGRERGRGAVRCVAPKKFIFFVFLLRDVDAFLEHGCPEKFVKMLSFRVGFFGGAGETILGPRSAV